MAGVIRMKLGDTREVIHNALAIGQLTPVQENYGTRIDHSPASSANNLICSYVEAGRILDAIDKLSDNCQWWLYCAYAPNDNNTVNFASHLGDELFRKYFQSDKEKRWPRLRRLSRIAVLDYKNRVNNGNPLTDAFISSQIGIHAPHYVERGWMKKLKTAQEELARLDLIGLEAVRAEVRRLRYGELDTNVKRNSG